jgi:DoxX-like family
VARDAAGGGGCAERYEADSVGGGDGTTPRRRSEVRSIVKLVGASGLKPFPWHCTSPGASRRASRPRRGSSRRLGRGPSSAVRLDCNARRAQHCGPMVAVPSPGSSKRTVWVVRILSALIVLAFVPSAILKLIHHPTAVEGFTRMGIAPGAFVPIAILELGCLTLYLLPRTVVLGTVLLTGYLGGATVANIIGRSDFIHALVVGLLVWAGAWLRVPELRTLVPIRKT